MNDESRKFFETVRDYLQIYMAKQRVMSQNTIASYKQAINQYLSFLVENKSIKYEAVCFRNWSAANINEYLLYLENERNIAASTRNQRLFAIRAFMKYARMANPELGHASLEVQSIAKAREDTEPVAMIEEPVFSANTRYVVQDYDVFSGETVEAEEMVPDKFMGLSRDRLAAEIGEYNSNPSLN